MNNAACGWRRWFAWRPVTIYGEILGEETSQGRFPQGRPSRVVWLKWIERRHNTREFRIFHAEFGDNFPAWEYRLPKDAENG